MFNSIPLTKYARIKMYIENLEDNIIIKNNHDKKVLEDIRSLIYERIESIKWMTVATTIIYVLLYFGFISVVFTDFFLLDEIINFINVLIGIVGTTILLISLFILNRIIDMYYGDLNMLSSHLISIYTKEGFNDEKMFEEVNQYEIFLSFFNKRGFMKEKK
jgi:hypothetical protein